MSLFDPKFLDAIERQTVENWEGIVWRATVGGSPVLRANIRGARWNPPGVEVLYCSLDEDGAKAELEHLLSTQPIEVKAVRKLTRIQVRLTRVVELSTPSAIGSIGHDITQVGSDNVLIPQQIGSAVEWLQIPGALVPGVRFPAPNLAIFYKSIVPPKDAIEVIETIDINR